MSKRNPRVHSGSIKRASSNNNVVKFPKFEKPRVGFVRRGEQDIRVKKQAVHLIRPLVWDRIGIHSQLANFFPCLPVVLRVDGIRQKKLRFSLDGVALYRNHDGRANEDPVVFLLGNNECALLNPKTFPQICRNDNRAPLSDPRRMQVCHALIVSKCLIFRQIALPDSLPPLFFKPKAATEITSTILRGIPHQAQKRWLA